MTSRPRLFIASSVERLDLAYAVQEALEHDAECTVWTQGVFEPSRSTMASLLDQLDETDYGVFLLAPDDALTIRGEARTSVRDNVVFELGLFIGRLGPERCFLFTPRGIDDTIHLPTDLLGITPVSYEPERQDKNLQAALGPACNRVRRSVLKLGSLKPPPLASVAESAPQDGLTEDEGDCVVLLQSWMGQRSLSQNRTAIRFTEVDRELRLTPGSTEKLIEEVAKRWKYVVDVRGKDTIMFKEAPLNRDRSEYF